MNINKIKEDLKAEYKYRIELHAHSKPVSPCSEIPPEQLIKVYKDLGFDAIALTNHLIIYNENQNRDEYLKSYFYDYEKSLELGEKAGIKVLFGTEIRFTENNNDYLIYGIDKVMLGEIYDLLPYGIENFRKNYPLDKSVFIQAHPFRNGIELVNPALLDGIEVYNLHPGHNSRVAVASAYAKENGKDIITIGTDYHHPGHEGLTALRSNILPEDSFGLAEILKSKDYIFEVADNNLIIP